GPPLVGIVAAPTDYWPSANANWTGWNRLVTAARASGLKNIPDVTMSDGGALARPADGQIESTVSNASPGAHRIVDLSLQYGLPSRPLVVVADVPLTDVANAYFLDRSVVDRVVVVAALGSYSAPNGIMGGPNG